MVAEEDSRELLQEVAEMVTQTESFTAAVANALQLTCAATPWVYGEAWVPDPTKQWLVLSREWAGDAPGIASFRAESEGMTFTPGEGLPGRVWQSGEVEWITDVRAVTDETFLRVKSAGAAGFGAAIGIPVIVDGDVVAVLVFFMDAARTENEDLRTLAGMVAVELSTAYLFERFSSTLELLSRPFDHIFGSLPVGVVMLANTGEIIRANDVAVSMLGLSHSELVSRAYDDPEWTVLDMDGRPVHPSEFPFATVMETHEPVVGYECEFIRPDGTSVWVSVNTGPVFDEGGDIAAVVSTLADVSDRQRYEQALKRQNDRLEEFVSIVSHDLRNPLAVARGYLELERADGDSEFLQQVADAHDRMAGLIDDLLTLARHGWELEPDEEEVDLAAAVEAAWEAVESDTATLTVGTLPTVVASPDRLHQLLTNVFGNAVMHGGPSVTVTVDRLSDGFYIEDDGPGIPPAHRGSVFEPGYTTHGEGTGFGLSIVNRIAAAHGWTVTLVDTDGGCRLEFRGVTEPA